MRPMVRFFLGFLVLLALLFGVELTPWAQRWFVVPWTDTLAAMKKLTNGSLSAVCAMSILAALSAANCARAATDLPAGSAKERSL